MTDKDYSRLTPTLPPTPSKNPPHEGVGILHPLLPLLPVLVSFAVKASSHFFFNLISSKPLSSLFPLIFFFILSIFLLEFSVSPSSFGFVQRAVRCVPVGKHQLVFAKTKSDITGAVAHTHTQTNRETAL